MDAPFSLLSSTEVLARKGQTEQSPTRSQTWRQNVIDASKDAVWAAIRRASKKDNRCAIPPEALNPAVFRTRSTFRTWYAILDHVMLSCSKREVTVSVKTSHGPATTSKNSGSLRCLSHHRRHRQLATHAQQRRPNSSKIATECSAKASRARRHKNSCRRPQFSQERLVPAYSPMTEQFFEPVITEAFPRVACTRQEWRWLLSTRGNTKRAVAEIHA